MEPPSAPGSVDYYQVLGIEKNCTQEEVKRAYRKLALRCHPDKNPDDPHCTQKFQDINSAYNILNDPGKRKVYDKYGTFGLYLMEQFGEESVNRFLFLNSNWFKAFLCCTFLVTGCCCGCCCFCCCCCNFCCGKFRPKRENYYDDMSAAGCEFEMDDKEAANDCTGNCSESAPMTGEPVTVQPGRESDGSQPRSSGDSPNCTVGMFSGMTANKQANSETGEVC